MTAVAPTPVDQAAAPAIVKEILDYLEAHAGATRPQVLADLRPGADPESAEAAELLLHLNNLVATGGAIEFFNGTLALPRGGARPEDKPAAGEKPAEEAPAGAAEAEGADAPPAAEAVAEPAVAEPAAVEAVPEEPPVAEPAAADSAAATEIRPE